MSDISTTTIEWSNRLKGDDLLKHCRIAEAAGLTTNDVIASAGYWRPNQDKVSLRKTDFWREIGKANGIMLSASAPATHSRKAKGILKVGPKTGVIPIGTAYLQHIGAGPGSYVHVEKEEGTEFTKPSLVIVLHEKAAQPESIARVQTEAFPAVSTPAVAHDLITASS